MKAVQGEKKHLRRYSVFGIGGLFFRCGTGSMMMTLLKKKIHRMRGISVALENVFNLHCVSWRKVNNDGD